MNISVLVTIKIGSHILFKTTVLKGAVKCEGFLLSKGKRSARAFRTNFPMSSDWLKVALLLSEMLRSMAWKRKKLASRTFIHDGQRKRFVLSIKDKNEDADEIVFQMICKSVLALFVVFLFYSVSLGFAIINIHILGYPDPRLSELSCGPNESG